VRSRRGQAEGLRGGRSRWFSPDEARQKINAGQWRFIDRLEELYA
jgi:predicted NUDIX family NTP pyrophosphohydrolase